MIEMETRLLMTFTTDSGRKVSLYVPDPREDLTETEIKDAMDVIVAKNIFEPSFGEKFVSALDAKVVQTKTTEYDLLVA